MSILRLSNEEGLWLKNMALKPDFSRHDGSFDYDFSYEEDGGGGVINKWECTDPDCAQYCRKIDDMRYECIEVRHCGLRYCVCREDIDLRYFEFDEVWNYCSSYYSSFEQIVNDYGFRKAFQIMAECIFEQTPAFEMYFVKEVGSVSEGIREVHDIIENRPVKKIIK